MVHNGCKCYFSFWAIFFPSTPLTVPKINIKKKMRKTPRGNIILNKCTKKHDNILHCS